MIKKLIEKQQHGKNNRKKDKEYDKMIMQIANSKIVKTIRK